MIFVTVKFGFFSLSRAKDMSSHGLNFREGLPIPAGKMLTFAR